MRYRIDDRCTLTSRTVEGAALADTLLTDYLPSVHAALAGGIVPLPGTPGDELVRLIRDVGVRAEVGWPIPDQLAYRLDLLGVDVHPIVEAVR